ncbi:serine/threonine protein kinase [Actinomadura rubrisoli]|uniref:Serine/threonine protein kinase n=2 Tax=Actinomadura rubrisoli TaxID=2530368 RepID=A0A4R5C0R0_9ACTN|nr:serine/threonine protein kinase [Actinomadura rubrisoli]
MPVPRPLRPNDPGEVGGFRLTARLGEGSQGSVYLGESGTGERVAVKVLYAEMDRDERARVNFERELAAARRVAPFCTARIFAAEAGEDGAYIVSEYIEGPSLRQLIAERGPIPAGELVRLAIGTATALAAIHDAGVVHRDFKPANVLLGPDGPKVIDFGVARPLEATSATMTGAVGTPAYMAPEQVTGASGGPPLDMFAWGCTMAYAANRMPPFGHDSIPATMHRILHAEPELGALGGTLRELVAACLHKDPARRPTALQVLTRLLGIGDDRDPLAEGTSVAATLTPGDLPAPPPLPSAAASPSPVPLPWAPPDQASAAVPVPLPYQAGQVPPPPFAQQTRPSSPSRKGRPLLIAGAAAGVLLIAGGTTAAVLLMDDDTDKPNARRPSAAQQPARGQPSQGSTGTGGRNCVYTPRPTSENAKEVGTPQSRAQRTGVVRATVKTNLGTLRLDLDAEKAPCTVNSMVYLAGRKFYDNTPCHRLTSGGLKVLQCGDPIGTGAGGPSYQYADENTSGARYTRGIVAMANAGPDTNGSQFFIVYGDSPLGPDYTIFGRVTSGMELVDKVAKAGSGDENGQGDGKPKQRIAVTEFRAE